MTFPLMPNHHKFDCSLISPPEREVVTKSGKRIDLLLKSQDWTMVLENKIFHEQNNPFSDYEDFVRLKHPEHFHNKSAIFIILSPEGKVPQGQHCWLGVSYPTLISNIKKGLAEHFIKCPLNKWVVILREFLLNLEEVMSQPKIPQESIDFVLQNLSAIQKLQNLKETTIKEYHQLLQHDVQQALGETVKTRLHHWAGLPALHFSLGCWENSESHVVLLLGNEDHPFRIYCYAELSYKEEINIADSFLNQYTNDELWSEDEFRGSSTLLKKAETEDLVQILVENIKSLHRFEERSRNPLII